MFAAGAARGRLSLHLVAAHQPVPGVHVDMVLGVVMHLQHHPILRGHSTGIILSLG